uniref:PAP-associated domain-containing protein n=2 Tax=Caenorhabditis tropicalis TaxID=1561998 RepID=A0A1I7UKC7_9PELO
MLKTTMNSDQAVTNIRQKSDLLLSKSDKHDNFIAQDEKRFPSKLDFGSPFPRPLPKVSKNFTLVAQLFVEFLCYYSEFDFENSFISIRNSRVEKRNSINNKSCISSNVKVYIEDPFDSHNPGRTVHSVEKMRYIFRATLKKFVPDNNENKNKSKNADNDFKLPSLNDILTMKLSDNLNGRNEDYD